MRVEPLRSGDPRKIGPYRVEGRIGCGGQGCVFLAKGPGRPQVAIKVLHLGRADDADARRRFAEELLLMRKVPPEHTAVVYDADVDGEEPYLVVEYIPGPSLQQAVIERDVIADTPLQRLATQMATALVAIHGAGVVHRDLKPANVLLGLDGVRVVDFGIAQAAEATALQTNVVMGTFAYMAPEQFSGKSSPATDVYAWAATLVFAASGRPPCGDEGGMPAIINRVLNQPPELGPITEPLRSIVRRCLAKRPEERPTAWWLLQSLLVRDPGLPVQPRTDVPPLRLTVSGKSYELNSTKIYTVGGPGCTIEIADFPAELLYLRYRDEWMIRVRVPDADIRVERAQHNADTLLLSETGANCTVTAYIGSRRVTCGLTLG
ncbi:hypothetical protein GCM10009555_054630 [Acrocarpospora macrocephala]|uniref:Protein kinase domain-containing protein n=1 Tax=Acrocarpospora macrocephala TaxID=150177 RepID=A0A5M3WY85_9ACTN|nr:serine/threonine-protein kinase [Acrocarpospora macrocephala]GES14455.1 hypothetical protein Amac_080520 [Acrocarpospora macrocephala]